MTNPDTTSAEGLEEFHNIGSTRLAAGRGEAWQDLRASIYAAARQGSVFAPAISEPVLSWTISGELEIEDREIGGPWINSSIKKGSLYLISGGAPYYCRWKTISPERHEYMLAIVSLPLLESALQEVYGEGVVKARLRDVSGFQDEMLSSLLEQVRQELTRRHPSKLQVQGLARLIAVHLARNYSDATEERQDSSALPGYKLRQITGWMVKNFPEDFNLDKLAAMAGLSRFHFHRLFKRATGYSPSRYHIKLRMNAARRLLRESKRSVVDVALEIGYTNPSHFAHLFRRDTGLSPSDYRRQR